MRARVIITLFATLGGLALVSACAEEEIVLARLPRSKDAGPSVEAKRCVDDDECGSDKAFCARAECGDSAGTCEARPVVCEELAEPVCGCDGITYWNDCLRRAAGVTAMRHHECELTSARTCSGPGEHGPAPGPGTERCPAGTYCARLLPPPRPGTPDTCPPDITGTCWALPAVCPPSSGPDRWIPCGGPDPRCRNTCDAIHTGEPHRRAFACP